MAGPSGCAGCGRAAGGALRGGRCSICFRRSFRRREPAPACEACGRDDAAALRRALLSDGWMVLCEPHADALGDREMTLAALCFDLRLLEDRRRASRRRTAPRSFPGADRRVADRRAG